MPQTPDKNQLPPEECYDEDDINFIELIIVPLKWKKLIFKVTVSAFFLSIIISLFLSNSFIATSRILPPKESGSSMSGLLSQVGGTLGGLASGILGAESTSELYIGILESRTVADTIIQKYNLMDLYEKKYMADVYEELSDNSFFEIDNKSQIISVSVEDEDPQRAADMANSYVGALDVINRTVNITEGQRKRIFLEKRLQTVKNDLIKAETDLKNFQEKYKLVSIDDQAKVAIEGAAQIKALIIEAQTELEVLKGYGTEKQNEVIRLQSRIAELTNQLSKIETGSDIKDNDSFYLPFNELPELGIQLARLMREFKIQESVFELLTSQYEMAKIEEAKDVNTIQVLDKAVPPDKKARPRRSLIVIFCTFLGFFLSVLITYFFQFFEKLKSEDQERYNVLKNNIKDIDIKKYRKDFQTWIRSLRRK